MIKEGEITILQKKQSRIKCSYYGEIIIMPSPQPIRKKKVCKILKLLVIRHAHKKIIYDGNQVILDKLSNAEHVNFNTY